MSTQQGSPPHPQVQTGPGRRGPKPEWQTSHVTGVERNQHTFLFDGLCMQQASGTEAEQTAALASYRAGSVQSSQLNKDRVAS